eukprot:362488-Chlamydomonas_euryale.AAC.4
MTNPWIATPCLTRPPSSPLPGCEEGRKRGAPSPHPASVAGWACRRAHPLLPPSLLHTNNRDRRESTHTVAPSMPCRMSVPASAREPRNVDWKRTPSSSENATTRTPRLSAP